MTASAPASNSSRANALCSALGQVATSTPQWAMAITTSASPAAVRTLCRTRSGSVSVAMPGESGPAGKLQGTIMDTPTNATVTAPSTSRRRCRKASVSLAPAPRATTPAASNEAIVSVSATGPKSLAWLFARLATSIPASPIL